MYSGFSRENGSVVGRLSGGQQQLLNLQDASETVGAEESLVCMDDDNQEIHFSAYLDPSSGELTWLPCQDASFVKLKTLAMSQMTSMLRDSHRNSVYEAAILRAIAAFTQYNHEPPVVLDIGTGTGLLAMLSIKHGAKFVFGAEMFDVLANTSMEIAALNGAEDKFYAINAKSTDIEELPMPIDLIVSEILDSALLGESVLPSHIDAIQRLMVPKDVPLNDGGGDGSLRTNYPLENRVIPNRAEVFATLIESQEVKLMVSVTQLAAGRVPLQVFRNEEARHCSGGWDSIPVRWEALEYRGARRLSDAVSCLKVPFWTPVAASGASGFCNYDTDIVVKQAGVVHGVLLWWKTYLLSTNLDPAGTLFYSTEPGAHPWQDHWQQTVFPLPEPIECSAGEVVRIRVCHDDMCLWLVAEKALSIGIHQGRTIVTKRNRTDELVQSVSCFVEKETDEHYFKKSCSCGWHLLCGPDRLQAMGDISFNSKWNCMMEMVSGHVMAGRLDSGNILDVSDGSMLAILLGTAMKVKPPPKQPLHIISKERKQFSTLFYSQLVETNDLESMVTIWNGDMTTLPEYLSESGFCAGDSDKISVLMSDCFYYQLHSLPVWQALSFHYQRTALSPFLTSNCLVIPAVGMIMALPLELPELRQCHGLAGE